MLAFGSPISAQAIMPPFTISLGFTPKKAIGQRTMSARRPGRSDPTVSALEAAADALGMEERGPSSGNDRDRNLHEPSKTDGVAEHRDVHGVVGGGALGGSDHGRGGAPVLVILRPAGPGADLLA